MDKKIILCCVNPIANSDNIDELSIYQIFKDHAIVKNVKIFSRDVQVKAFVEIDAESVDKCIKTLHFQNSEIGKLKVYVSHKDNITFDKDLKTIFNELLYRNDPNSHKQSYNGKGSEINTISNKKPVCDYVNGSHMSKPKFSQESESIENLEEIFDKNLFIDYKNIRSVTDVNSKLPDMIKYYPVSLENIHTVNPSHANEQEISKVLIVNRINTDKVNCLMLMNLFGCFGNVKKVLLNIKASFALIEMESTDHSILATTHLNGVPLFGNTIKVKCSKYNTVSLKSLEKEQNPDIQFLRGHYKYFRYKEGLQIKVNKPSTVLHITSLSSQFTPYLLCQLLSQLHEPSKIVKLSKSGNTSDMYLVEFDEISQAVEILSVLHNRKVDGKLMKISFSHTDINEFS